MFDTRKFGAFVAARRRDADMTQSALAERLNLTRQAVSKYETGDSFPDISILIEIAEVFGMSLDELINSGGPTEGESAILKNDADGEVEIDDVVNVAPLVKPSVLKEFAKRLDAQNIDISHIVRLVQYLNGENISRLLENASYGVPDGEALEQLAPFLDEPSKLAILEKIIEGESDWRLLKVMLPYIEDRFPILEAAVIDGALPNDVLKMLHEHTFGGAN